MYNVHELQYLLHTVLCTVLTVPQKYKLRTRKIIHYGVRSRKTFVGAQLDAIYKITTYVSTVVHTLVFHDVRIKPAVLSISIGLRGSKLRPHQA